MAGTKADAIGEALEAIRTLQSNFQSTEVRLQRVEEASKCFGETQQKMDDKIDAIHKLLTEWNSTNDLGSSQKSPPPQVSEIHSLLTANELAFLKKQEA
jgi:hypothetical protein